MEQGAGSRVMRLIVLLVSLLLAAFFGFVGYNKAFASLSDLARYGSWTIWIPAALGRIVGWSEMACAVALASGIVRRFIPVARASAGVLIANQFCAAAVHASHGELKALPQNAVLILLLARVASYRPRLTPPDDQKGPL